MLTLAAKRANAWRNQGILHGSVLAAADVNGEIAIAADGYTIDGEPLTPDHRFLITSVTKALTATQVLAAADDGLVDLRASLAEYIPDFAGSGKEQVQVWHVLAHCAGISLHANLAEGPPTRLTAEQLRRLAIQASLARPPGGEAEYCSPGMWLLAELIERVSGVGYVEHLHTYVLAPLGVTGIGYVPQDDPGPRYVPAHAERNLHLAEQVRRLAYPAGGLVSTAGDLARFGASVAASLHGRPDAPLSPAMVRACSRVWSRGRWPDGRPQTWGLGWELAGPGDGWGDPTLFHFGASGTGLWVDLERGVAFALLTADWYLPRRRYAEIANAFTNALTRGQHR